MQVTRVWSLGGGHVLEKGLANHSSILAWRIPWTEEPGGLQSLFCMPTAESSIRCYCMLLPVSFSVHLVLYRQNILLKCNFDHVSTFKSLLSRKDFYLHFVPRAVHTCVTMNNTELYSFFTDIFIQQTTIQWQLCASWLYVLTRKCLNSFTWQL